MLYAVKYNHCSLEVLCACVSVGFRDKKTPMDLVTRALNIFMQTKLSLNTQHEFALMLLDNCAKWVSDVLSCRLELYFRCPTLEFILLWVQLHVLTKLIMVLGSADSVLERREGLCCKPTDWTVSSTLVC